MNSLYNITNNFVSIMDKVENGEISEEEYNELGQELAIELQNKSVNLVAYVRNEESNSIDKFKQYVKENMEKLNLTKIPTELGNLTIAKNPLSIEIENEDEIPEQFKQEIVTTKIDKTAIKKYFKETGEILPGIKIINDKTSLRIK